jgi:hypothetical protein
MQEFAPTKSRLSGNCPSDEELAAYIDGNLDKDEADRIAEHLVACERCHEIYSETLQFQLDSEPVTNVVPFPSRQEKGRAVLRYGFPIAALLLVGIGSGRYFLTSPPALTPAMVTASLQEKPEIAKSFWLGPTMRGPGDDEDRPIDAASFQMGVQLVNLRLSLASNDAEEARGNILPRIRQVLDTQSGASPLAESYGALSKDLQGKPAQELLEKANQVARESRDYFDESYLDLGQWVEAAHLSAMAGNPSFFRQADTRSFLRHLLWRDKLGFGDTKLDPTTRASLDRISGIVSKSDLGASDYSLLRQELEKILEHYYPMT